MKNTKKQQVIEGGKIIGKMEFVLRDKFGNIKRLWNENRLGKWLRLNYGIDSQSLPIWSKWIFGKFSSSMALHNLIVSAGKAGVASRINGSGAEAAFTYLAVGTGTTSPAAGDTTLETEIVDSGLARAAASVSRETTSVTNDTAVLDETYTVTGTKAVTEAGALNAASSGTLLGRQTFSAINVVSGDTLQIIYKFQAS